MRCGSWFQWCQPAEPDTLLKKLDSFFQVPTLTEPES